VVGGGGAAPPAARRIQLFRYDERPRQWASGQGHQRVKSQREDVHHKTALLVLRQYDAICLDDLRIAAIIRNRRLAKSIGEAGGAAFRTILEAKAACAGRRELVAAPAYTLQDMARKHRSCKRGMNGLTPACVRRSVV
jgi:putative transposase